MSEIMDQGLEGPENGSQGPPGELRVRDAQTIGVSFPKRIIELIVTPYETETHSATIPGRAGVFTEIFSRGAYDGIERRANRIRVNRDHDTRRTVGRAVAFHPSREEGLVAELRIAHTDLGNETLALADEDCLDASAGYVPMPGGEKWEARDRLRVNKAWLGHIALTAIPAYDAASVLAVRNAGERKDERGATPNRDQLELQRLKEQYAIIDARYGLSQR
jgi:HK97 family phage prohead protease